MRRSICPFLVAVIGGVALMSGCSGGTSIVTGGRPASGVPTAGTTSEARVTLSGAFNGTGPQLLARVRRLSGLRHTMVLAFKSILVQGTLYPGDAGDNVITNSTTIPVPSGGVYSASVSFSSVPVHNNEWGLLQFIGVAADGSQTPIGELAGIINVAASPANSSTLTEATTQTFQVFTTLLTNGEIGTYDLDNTATLSSTLASDISATGVTPEPTTHLFDASELLTLYDDIAPKFERNATISASPSLNGYFILLRDYTNASELDLTSNMTNFFSTFALAVEPPVVGAAFGSICGSFTAAVLPHSPETNPVPIPSVVGTPCFFAEEGSQTVRNVYGGHVLIGATNDSFLNVAPVLPFDGGFTSFAGHVPGSFSVIVPTASTQLSIKATDPVGFAFGTGFYFAPAQGIFSMQPGFGNTPLSATTFQAAVPRIYRILPPTPYSSTSNTVIVDTFTPWDIAAPNLQLCGGISCFALTAAQPLAIKRPFADGGTDLAYFGWKTSGTATGISQVSPKGYAVKISGAGTATITTTTASLLTPRQSVFIDQNSAAGTTWTVTAKDAAGNTYSDFGFANSINEVTIPMNSVANMVATTSIAISFTTTAAGTITVFFIT